MEHVTGEQIAERMVDQAYGAHAYRDARESRTGTPYAIERDETTIPRPRWQTRLLWAALVVGGLAALNEWAVRL